MTKCADWATGIAALTHNAYTVWRYYTSKHDAQSRFEDCGDGEGGRSAGGGSSWDEKRRRKSGGGEGYDLA